MFSSASEVRQLRKAGKKIQKFVPEKVLKYIETHRLYTPTNPAMEMPWQITAPVELYQFD